MARAVGIGGVFLRTSNPEELYAWYETHLKLKREHGCFIFKDEPRGEEQRSKDAVVAFFPQDTDYMGAVHNKGGQAAMLNFRVEGLDELLAELSRAGVEVDPKRETHEYGKFGWFNDPEGNRVELWEPPPAEPEPH